MVSFYHPITGSLPNFLYEEIITNLPTNIFALGIHIPYPTKYKLPVPNLAIEGLHILAMTLTDAVSPIGLLSIRCPTALFWRSLARTLSSQLQDCYN